MDFLTVQWSKLDSLPEFIMLIGGIAAGTPFTWTTSDYMGITGNYEAA